MRKIKRCPAKIGNPVEWRHLLRHWFTLYDKIKTVITFLLFDRFWQMTQICQIIFCEFFKKKISHFLGTTLVTSSPLVMTSNIYVTNDVIAHVLWVKWSQTIFFEKYSPMPWFWYIDCPDRSRNKKVMVFWKWRK